MRDEAEGGACVRSAGLITGAKGPMASLEDTLDELERDAPLYQADRLRERVEALDWLETCLIGYPESADLHRRVDAIRTRLESANDALYENLRERIRRGEGRDVVKRWRSEAAAGESYDHLDDLVGGILQLPEPDAPPGVPDREMVRYQPTPARHVLDLIERASLGEDDVLVDIGSGLGHVSLLAAIGTRARAIGIEREAAYVECAAESARRFGLSRAAFLAQDARDADYSVGSLFYFYTPFTGSILRAVLDALRREAGKREFRVGAFGPCVPAIAGEPWLDAIGNIEQCRVALLRSRA